MTKDEIFAEAKKWASKFDLSFDAEYDAECGFIAGAMFVQQLLQQTPCTTQLPQVEQSLLDEAVSDIINISKLNPTSIAKRLIKEQFYVGTKEDLSAAIA